MNRLELAALAAALEHQTGAEVHGVITYERMYEALTDGPKFSQDERRLLWFSPDVRALYAQVRRSVDRETSAKLREAGYGEELHLRAAADTAEVQTIRGKGYVLTIFRDDEPEEEWSLSLRLEPALRSILPSRSVVKLADLGGLTWVEGIPDGAGQISALWQNKDETPIARAVRFGLVFGI